MEVGALFKISTVKPTRKRPLRRPIRIWKNNIIMDLKEINNITRNWFDSAKEKDYSRTLVNVALNLLVP